VHDEVTLVRSGPRVRDEEQIASSSNRRFARRRSPSVRAVLRRHERTRELVGCVREIVVGFNEISAEDDSPRIVDDLVERDLDPSLILGRSVEHEETSTRSRELVDSVRNPLE
jgi:hypothetical protein